jgi:hypothetical protein
VSPLLVNVMNPSERFLSTVANGHALQRFAPADLAPAPFSRLDCYWGMAPTRAYDVSAFIYNRTRQFDNTIPRTPFGFVGLLAGSAPSGSGTPWTATWITDGDKLGKAGRPFALEAARDAMRADLQAGAQKFPFRVEGEVFWQLVSQGPGQFLLYLIDPGYLDPADRSVMIRAQTPGVWQATDRLTRQALGVVDQGLALPVPAGTLRLVEIRSTNRQPGSAK